MRKENKQLNRPLNKVECQFFSAAPEVNPASAASDQDKTKGDSLSYNLTIEPLKEENDYEIINTIGNVHATGLETSTTSSKAKDAIAASNDNHECDAPAIHLLKNYDQLLEDDEDTITLLIPDRSFTESADGENMVENSRESSNRLTFRANNPFETDHEDDRDDSSTLVGSNYGDDTSSLFHENNNLLEMGSD